MAGVCKLLAKRLDLRPHPEGGWYRETWRAQPIEGERSIASAVLYLLEASDRSQWNRNDAAEMWLWHAGDPLILQVALSSQGPTKELRLGMTLSSDELPQRIVPAGAWQAARPEEKGRCGYSLVSCIVVPAFEFSNYEIAPSGWVPGS